MVKSIENGASLAFESQLWRTADGLQSNMDAAECIPYSSHVLDLCCGSGGMSVQSLKPIEARKAGNGQERQSHARHH